MKKNTKYHIHIVTTEGCMGCKIMTDLVHKALSQFPNIIACNTSDFTKLRSKDPSKDKFRDFPTTLFVNDGVVMARLEGTYPVPDIVDRIKYSFDIKTTAEMEFEQMANATNHRE